jgi:transposase
LLGVLEGSPQDHGYRRPAWTQELLILVLAQRTEITISVSTMSRLLARSMVRLGRPKPIVGCPWPRARRARRLRAIRRLIEGLDRDEVVVDVDEVDIHLNPQTGPDWMRRGRQKGVLTPGCNEKRYLAGALNAETRRLTWVEGDQKNSLLFLRLLDKLVTEAYPKARRIHLVLDNFGIHDSRQVQLALKSEKGSKIRLHFLPPYRPDHNRIERVWKDLHDNVTRNHRCAGMEGLTVEVRRYLQTRNRHRRQAYVEGDIA